MPSPPYLAIAGAGIAWSLPQSLLSACSIISLCLSLSLFFCPRCSLATGGPPTGTAVTGRRPAGEGENRGAKPPLHTHTRAREGGEREMCRAGDCRTAGAVAGCSKGRREEGGRTVSGRRRGVFHAFCPLLPFYFVFLSFPFSFCFGYLPRHINN